MTIILNRKLHVVDLGDRRVEYRVRFSRRATRCRISVRPDGVEVILPRDTDEDRADSFLRENETWALDQLAFLDRMGSVRAKSKKKGHSVLLRGKDTAVEIVEENSERRFGLVEITDAGLRIRLPRGQDVDPWRTLEAWFRRQARQDILERVEERRREMPRSKFGRLYVMGQRTKWGGCSGRRNLSFNWRLVMAPPAVLDYIVVHELAHLAEPSHSAKFWLIVRSHCPRFEEHKAWLKDNEDRMRLPE
jgi:predicted metal-dependent hydrolase